MTTSRLLHDIAAYDFGGPGLNLGLSDRPEQVRGIRVSEAYFRLFGATADLGRTFTPDEDRLEGDRVVVISYALWENRLGADPNLAGKTILLGGEPYTVVGVLGSGFIPDPPAEVWLPLQADPNSTNQSHHLLAAARLNTGVTLPEVRTRMKLAAEEFRREFPGVLGSQESFTAELLRDTTVSNVRPALLVLVAASIFVLLIACANVANLLLARAIRRQREIAIRAALGAGRSRIIRHLLTESVLLSLLGGAAGLLVGSIGVRALLAINPGRIPRIGEAGSAVTLDWRVLVFTMLIALVTGILFGFAPVFNIRNIDLSTALNEASVRSGSSRRQNRLRDLLVVAEMALALVLPAGAAALIRTFIALRSINPGFDAHHILTLETSLAGMRFDRTADVARLAREGIRRIETVPGVMAATTTRSLPLEPTPQFPFIIEGRPLGDLPYHGGGNWRSVSPRFFEVFKIPLLRGRVFSDRDSGEAPGVVVINETMAKRFWPADDPIGRRIIIGRGGGPDLEEPARQIVGVVGDVRDNGLNKNPEPIMYVPVGQVPDGITALNNRVAPLMWAIRTRGEPYAVSTAVEHEIESVNGNLAAAHIRSMEQVVEQSTARDDFNTLLLTTYALLALSLAAIGIYGVMAYSVQQRRYELVIRVALGASPRDIRNIVIARGMRLTVIGTVAGVAAADSLTRLMESMLYGVRTSDPLMLVAVAILLGAVAFLASFVPALRATRVNPMIALKGDGGD